MCYMQRKDLNMSLNKIYVDDCISFLKKLDDDCIDMVLSSPPYDDLRTYKGIEPFTWFELGKELHRVIKPGRAIVIVIQDACVKKARTGTSFRMIVEFMDLGLRLWECLIYHRIGAPVGGERFRLTHEYMPVFFRGDDFMVCNEKLLRVPRNNYSVVSKSSTRRKKDGGFTTQSCYDNNSITKKHETIFSYTPSMGDTRKEKLFHPATFPDQLAHDMISVFSHKDDIILDPFMGSGTTAYQAKIQHRNYIGCDVSKEYVERAQQIVDKANIPIF